MNAWTFYIFISLVLMFMGAWASATTPLGMLVFIFGACSLLVSCVMLLKCRPQDY